jgi:hypothetical protein
MDEIVAARNPIAPPHWSNTNQMQSNQISGHKKQPRFYGSILNVPARVSVAIIFRFDRFFPGACARPVVSCLIAARFKLFESVMCAMPSDLGAVMRTFSLGPMRLGVDR